MALQVVSFPSGLDHEAPFADLRCLIVPNLLDSSEEVAVEPLSEQRAWAVLTVSEELALVLPNPVP